MAMIRGLKYAPISHLTFHLTAPAQNIPFSRTKLNQTQGYGISKYPSEKVTPSTLFYTGSTTKAFTAAAVSLLIDNSSSFSNIAWDTPISRLLPSDFILSDSYATTHITLEDALSHRTGMPRHDSSYGGLYGEDHHEGTPRDVVRSLRDLPMTKEPRTTWQYCNMMYVVASHVVEKLTGVWLGLFLREWIWEPLGMGSTVSLLFTGFIWFRTLKVQLS